MSQQKTSNKQPVIKLSEMLKQLPEIVEISDEQMAMIVGGTGTIKEGVSINHNEIMVDAESINSQKQPVTSMTTLLKQLPEIMELSDEELGSIAGAGGFTGTGGMNHNQTMVDAESIKSQKQSVISMKTLLNDLPKIS